MKTAKWLPVAFLTACGTSTKSTNVETRGFYPKYTIEVRRDGQPSASATLRVGDESGVFLDLVGGDALACNGTPLLNVPTMAATYYSAILPASQATYVFVLTRPGEGDYRQQVPTPVAFSITSSSLDGTYDSQFTLTWTSPATAAKVSITQTSSETACPGGTLVTDAADSGSFAFDGSSFRPPNSSSPDCTYALHVAREETAPAGPPFAGGKLVSRFVETTSLHLHP